jgi:hypothetical protein
VCLGGEKKQEGVQAFSWGVSAPAMSKFFVGG